MSVPPLRSLRPHIGGSHSHTKRLQLTQRIQQKAYQASSSQGGAPPSPWLSGIPPAGSSGLKHSASQPTLYQAGMFTPVLHHGRTPTGSEVVREGGSVASQYKQGSFIAGGSNSRTSTGYFSIGGVSARYAPHVPMMPVVGEEFPLPPGSVRRSTLPHTLSSLKGISRSLGASKASLVSYKSGKTSIQQETHDRDVRKRLRHPASGEGRLPLFLSFMCLFLFALTLLTGIIVIILRQQGTLFLTVDKGEIIGPLLIAGSFVFSAMAVRLVYSAYRLRSKEVHNLRFFPTNASLVGATAVKKVMHSHFSEHLLSGTATKSAVTRTPVSSRAGSIHSLSFT